VEIALNLKKKEIVTFEIEMLTDNIELSLTSSSIVILNITPQCNFSKSNR
jgi:hypothetical protein